MALTQITTKSITDGTIATADIADQAVTLDKLPHGDGSNNGKFLRANNGADPTFETINTDLVSDTSPQLGGELQTNGNDIDFADSDKALFGNSGDFDIHHNGTYNYVLSPNGHTMIVESDQIQLRSVINELYFKGTANGSAELYYDSELRFSTTAAGATLIRNGADDTDVLLLVENQRDDSNSHAILRLRTSNGSANSQVQFGDAGNQDTGIIDYEHSNNRMRFTVDATDVWHTRSNGICPSGTGMSCGFSNSTNRWDDVRSNNFGGSSDRNEKNTIVTSDLGLDFINKLKPVSFKWNHGNAGRTHYGLISQDIEDLLPDFSKTAMDFAGLCKDTITQDDEGNSITPYDIYGLRYMEFIAPLVKAIQELSTEVQTLKTKVAALEAK